MKYKKELFLSVTCLLLSLFLSIAVIQHSGEKLADSIAPAVLRFHVLANSNSSEDQQLKLEVRTLLLDTLYEKLGENSTKTATEKYVKERSAELEEIAMRFIKDKGFSYSAKITTGQFYFPSKTYGDLVFPCGTYDAVRIIIGEGNGKNWWCVLYPQLCFVSDSYAIVPETSKQQLKAVIPDDDYNFLIQRPGHVSVRFKLWDTLCVDKMLKKNKFPAK